MRNLYRTYLYAVCIALLAVITVAVQGLLSVLFRNTSLRGQYTDAPTNSSVVQATTFFLVALVVGGLIGGLHYWLIRRDMAADPTASGSGVRSFFLNIPQAIAALVSINALAGAVSALGINYADISTALSLGLAEAGFFGVLALESRRGSGPATRAALVFRRIHVFIVPLAIVLFGANFWLSALTSGVGSLYAATGSSPFCSPDRSFSAGPCISTSTGGAPNLGGQWGAALIVALAWVAYTYWGRNDGRSTVRLVAQLAGFFTGLVFVVVSIYRGLDLLLLHLFGQGGTWFDAIFGPHFFIPTLIFGLIVGLAYLALYRSNADAFPTGGVFALRTLLVTAGLTFAVPFWWGCGALLQWIVEHVSPGGVNTDGTALAAALALLLAGIAYPPLALALQRGSDEADVPRRAFLLALLAGGTITGVVGLVIALRALFSTALGAPLDDWQHITRSGAVALVIGAVIVAIYVTLAMRERAFSSPIRLPTTPSPENTIEAVLDELLAGKISRDEAAARIRTLSAVRA